MEYLEGHNGRDVINAISPISRPAHSGLLIIKSDATCGYVCNLLIIHSLPVEDHVNVHTESSIRTMHELGYCTTFCFLLQHNKVTATQVL